MVKQKEIFKASEGDQWFQRNKNLLNSASGEDDEIVKIIKSLELFPKKTLEIGCSEGHRLGIISKAFKADCYGIDPSSIAINNGKRIYPNIALQVGTADELPFDDNSFDMIIFGFCLYLCDRDDLFKIAYEADRCLQNKGALIIKDFYPPFPYKNKYSHHEGIYSYKMNYSHMFTWNPAYSEISEIVFSHSGFAGRDLPDERLAIILLKKNMEYAYPEEPFHFAISHRLGRPLK